MPRDSYPVPSPTPLVPLSGTAPGVYAKLELLHPSGSIKHRSIPQLLAGERRAGELPSGREIVVHSAGSAAITTAWAGARLGCPVQAVVPRNCAMGVERKLRWLGAQCHRIASRDAEAFIDGLVESGAYRLDQQQDPRLVDHYGAIADEILASLPEVAVVVMGIGTGASISGVARGLHRRGSDCRVIGVEPDNCRVAAGQSWAPHRIPGLSPPFPQPLLELQSVDELVGVCAQTAWQRSQWLARKEGWLACPASGATVEAALRLKQERGTEPIVAVLSGCMEPLLDSEHALDADHCTKGRERLTSALAADNPLA